MRDEGLKEPDINNEARNKRREELKRLKESKKKKNKMSSSNCGTIAKVKRKGNDFTVDGENYFFHKRKSNVRISTRSQRFSKPPEVSTDFFFEFNEIFEEFNLDKHVITDGCFDTNKHTLQDQISCRNFTGSVAPDLNSLSILKKAVNDSIRKMKIQELGNVNISMISDFDFDLSTSPGFRFEHYFNARNKREEDAICGEFAKSRVVHMPEFHTELHGGIFSDLITQNIVERGEGPIYIGNSFVKFERFEKQMKRIT